MTQFFVFADVEFRVRKYGSDFAPGFWIRNHGFEQFSIGNPPDHYQNSPSDPEISEMDQISIEDISELKRS